MMLFRRVTAVIVLIAIGSVPLNASTMQAAKEHIAKGEKREAWAILYPMAKKEGSSEAQYLLGYLLLNSPNLSDHLQKALIYFEAAEKGGHRSAGVAVEGVRRQIAEQRRGRSVVERSKALYEQNRREWTAYAKQIEQGFVTGDGDVVPHKLDVFVTGGSDITKDVTRIVSQKRQLSASLLLNFHLVINKGSLGDTDIFPPGYQPPKDGFAPDINGELAKKYGINDFPALVLQTSRGAEPKLISLSQFRSWANKWSPNR